MEPTQENLMPPPESVIDLWTDGSGTTRDHPGGWAWLTEDGRCESGFFTLDATNHRAELMALLQGLRALEAPARVVVHSDSLYLVGPRTKDWLRRWRRQAWRSVNADLWQALLGAAEQHDLSFEWVRAHTGLELNEECDKLAGIARRAAIALRQEDVASAQSPGEVSTPRPPRPWDIAMAGPDSALCAFLLASVTFSDASWSARAGGATREPGELRAAFIRRVLGRSPGKEDECSPSS